MSDAVQVVESQIDVLRQQSRTAPGTLFAVLDATNEPRIPRKMEEIGEKAMSLYHGAAARDYWAVAPYLVSVDEAVLNWIHENLWEEPWGIVVIAPLDLAGLRNHLRRFLKVKDPEGKLIYFRFYDPRVLPTFLATCTRAEAEAFFGAIQRFAVSRKQDVVTFLELAGRDHGPMGR